MAEIRHLENRNDVIFLPMGSSMWTKFGRLVQNDMPTAVMWTKSKTEVALQAPRNQNNFMALALRAALTIGRVSYLNLYLWYLCF